MANPVKHYDKWRIRWIDSRGNRHSETYDDFSDAQFALKRHEIQMEEERRGLRQLSAPEKTFDELCDYYFTYYSAQKRRQRDDESVLRVHLRPFFGAMKIHEVYDRVEAYKVERAYLHPNTVHHHLTLLITMLRVA
ncbi:MAG: hypothetical protein WCG27_07595, partial [Pseudomonadota bacterium]